MHLTRTWYYRYNSSRTSFRICLGIILSLNRTHSLRSWTIRRTRLGSQWSLAFSWCDSGVGTTLLRPLDSSTHILPEIHHIYWELKIILSTWAGETNICLARLCKDNLYSKALRLKKSSFLLWNALENIMDLKKKLPPDGAFLEPKKGGEACNCRELVIIIIFVVKLSCFVIARESRYSFAKSHLLFFFQSKLDNFFGMEVWSWT